MSLQCIQPDKRRLASFTDVLLDTGMKELVTFQIVSTGETFVASDADEGLDSLVRTDVPFEVVRSCKSLATVIACKLGKQKRQSQKGIFSLHTQSGETSKLTLAAFGSFLLLLAACLVASVVLLSNVISLVLVKPLVSLLTELLLRCLC